MSDDDDCVDTNGSCVSAVDSFKCAFARQIMTMQLKISEKYMLPKSTATSIFDDVRSLFDTNYGLFAPKTICSWERTFQVWNFWSLELSLPPMNVANDVVNDAVLPLTVMPYVKLFNVCYCVVYFK